MTAGPPGPAWIYQRQGKEGSMKRKALIGVGMAALLVMAWAGLAGAAEVRGVTDTTIKIGQWSPQTGPAALWARWPGAPASTSR